MILSNKYALNWKRPIMVGLTPLILFLILSITNNGGKLGLILFLTLTVVVCSYIIEGNEKVITLLLSSFLFISMLFSINLANSMRNALLSIFITTIYLLNKDQIVQPKYIYLNTLLPLLATIMITGPALLLDPIKKLAYLLNAYDFGAHGYIVRLLAICNQNLNTCNYEEIKLSKTSIFSNYPDMIHKFFAQILSTEYISDKTYLSALAVSIYFSMMFSLSLMIYVLKELKLINQNRNSFFGFLHLCAYSLVLYFGVISSAMSKGYLNFAPSMTILLFSFSMIAKQRWVWFIGSLLVACEMWSFFYFPSLFVLVLLIRRMKLKQAALIILIFGLGFAKFLFVSFSSSASSNGLVGSGNSFISILLLGLCFIMWRSRQSEIPLEYRSVFKNFYGGFFIFGLFFEIYGISKGVTSPYYLEKALTPVILLAPFQMLYRCCMPSTKNLVNLLKWKDSRNLKFEVKSIKYRILYLFPACALSLFLMGQGMNFANAKNFTNQLLGKAPNWHAWTPEKEFLQQSANILLSSKRETKGVPVFYAEDRHWYQSTQWLNNINLSWSDDLQQSIDEIRNVNSTTSELNGLNVSSIRKLNIRIIVDQCKIMNADFIVVCPQGVG